jgi:hypothetical protein
MTGLLERAEAEMRHAERGAEFLDQFRWQRQAQSHTEGREEPPAGAASQLSQIGPSRWEKPPITAWPVEWCVPSPLIPRPMPWPY